MRYQHPSPGHLRDAMRALDHATGVRIEHGNAAQAYSATVVGNPESALMTTVYDFTDKIRDLINAPRKQSPF